MLTLFAVDDGSGATITALVSPASVHGMSLQQQFDSHFPPRRRKTSNSSVFNNDFQAPPPASDPRLWVYRYSKPPPPIKTINQRFTPTLKVPLYEEGTVVRITGSIVLSPKNQWERQIDVKTLVPIEGTAAKYAEHHHAIAVRNLKRDLYCNPAAVADKLVLTDQAENDRMQLDTKPSSSVDSSQADRSSLTELGSVADASGLVSSSITVKPAHTDAHTRRTSRTQTCPSHITALRATQLDPPSAANYHRYARSPRRIDRSIDPFSSFTFISTSVTNQK